MFRHAILVAVALAAVAPTQDRRALLGRALDQHDRPVAGATVTLVRCEVGAAGLVDADVVTASSDASGWFKAPLLLGALYDGWVIGPERDGGASISRPMRMLAAGGTYELRCETAAARQQVQLQGAAAWPGPLRCELFADEATPCPQPLALDADGKATLPWLPRTRHALAVYLPDGGLLQWCSFGDDAGDATELTLAPPVAVPVLALDEQGAPVAGVLVWQRVAQVMRPTPFDVFGVSQHSLWRPLGTTAADGRLVVQLPLARDPLVPGSKPQLVLRASKTGCADSHSGWMGSAFRDGLRLADDAEVKQVEFVMHPADPAKGQLLAAPGQPIAGAHIRLTAISKVARDNGWSHLPRTFDVATDAQGFYAVPQLPPDAYDFEILIATPTALRQPLADARAPVRPALSPLLAPLSGHAATLPVIDLQQTIELELRVLDATKGPARGACVAMYPIEAQQHYIPGAVHPIIAVDPAGRADLRLAPGRWMICALGRAGFCYYVIETDSLESPLAIELQPFATMHCRIVDADGKPIAGALATRFGNRPHRGNNSPERDLLDRLRGSIDAYALALEGSAADGSLTVQVMADDADLGSVRITRDGQAATLPMEPGDKVVEVVLR